MHDVFLFRSGSVWQVLRDRHTQVRTSHDNAIQTEKYV